MSDLKNLKAEKEKWITRIFFLSLETALIFLLPALLTVLLIKKEGFPVASLGAAFVFSWIIVGLRYRAISKKLKSIDAQIKKAEQKETSK